jgi:hypothetical protein
MTINLQTSLMASSEEGDETSNHGNNSCRHSDHLAGPDGRNRHRNHHRSHREVLEMSKHPLPWRHEQYGNGVSDIVDAEGNCVGGRIFGYKHPQQYVERIRETNEYIVKAVNALWRQEGCPRQ